MDVNQVYQALEGTLSSDTPTRNAAEAALKQFSDQHGYLASLFQLVGSQQVPLHIRQAGAVFLKNQVRRRWEPHSETAAPIPNEEKDYVRQNLVAAIAGSSGTVRAQLCVCAKDIAESDFPSSWPEVIPQLKEALVPTNSTAHLIGALYIARNVIKAFQFRTDEMRGPLELVASEIFAQLLVLFETAIQHDSLESAGLQHLIVKTAMESCSLAIPKYFLEGDSFSRWMTCVLQIMQRDIITEPQFTAEPERSPRWKCLRWALVFCHRLFERYANPKLAPQQFQAFSQSFNSLMVQPILERFLGVLARRASSQIVSDRVLAETLAFLTSALPLGKCYSIMKPNIPAILSQVIFPILCFDEKDAETWASDPHDYVRLSFDLTLDFYSPRMTAQNFLIDLCKKRTKDSLPIMMTMISQIFNADPQTLQPNLKDGAMNCFGILHMVLMKSEHKEQLESIIINYILPELQSQSPFLRARACEVLGHYSFLEFKDIPTFQTAVTHILNNMSHPELPVRVYAATSLRRIVNNESAGPVLRPVLGAVVEQLFNLMDDVGNEELASTLEMIIDNFEEELLPHAVFLAQKLSMAFQRTVESADDEDEEAALAAMGCTRAIITLLTTLQHHPDMLCQCEPHILPIVEIGLKDETFDFLEDVLEILTFFTFVPAAPSAAAWSFFDKVIETFARAFDWVQDMVPPLDNFMSKGTAVFLSDPHYAQGIMTIYEGIVTNPNASDRDLRPAFELIESYLLNCRGHTAHNIPRITELASKRMAVGFTTKQGAMFCSEIIATALFCDPQSTLAALHHSGALPEVFTVWFQNLENFPRLRDKKCSILGLSSLLKLDVQGLPETLQQGLPQIIKGLVMQSSSLIKQAEQRAEEEDAEESEEESDEEDDGNLDIADDEDEDCGDEEEYLSLLDKLAKTGHTLGDLDSDSLDSDDDEDVIRTSVIDDIDEIVFFASCFHEFNTRNGALVQQLVVHLTDEEKAALSNLGAAANKRVADKQARQLQAQQPEQ